MRIDGSLALITGASRGLGRALAIELAEKGARLALVARDETALANLVADLTKRGAVARSYPCDLRRYADSSDLIARVHADLGAINLLICNAATGSAGEIADVPLAAFEENLAVNFLAPAALVRAFLDVHQTGSPATICFVQSGAALRGLPSLSAYSTGKAALAVFADILRVELRGSGVRVLTVFPGLMDTELTARMPRFGGAAKLYEPSRRTPPPAVARSVVRAIESDRQRLFRWGPARLVYHLDHFAPSLVDWLLARMRGRGPG